MQLEMLLLLMFAQLIDKRREKFSPVLSYILEKKVEEWIFIKSQLQYMHEWVIFSFIPWDVRLISSDFSSYKGYLNKDGLCGLGYSSYLYPMYHH